MIDSGLKPSHILEIRNHFRNHGSSISRIHVQGVPQLEDAEQLADVLLGFHSLAQPPCAALFSNLKTR